MTSNVRDTLRWCRAIRRRPARAAQVARNVVDTTRVRGRGIRCTPSELATDVEPDTPDHDVRA